MKSAGIGKCKAGWLCISFDDDGNGYNVFHAKEELKKAFETYDRIFINVPVGLEEEALERECDILLKKELGTDYSDEVIIPPIRPALEAPSYAEGNIINYEYNGEKLRLETWNLMPKIRVVDELLREQVLFKERVLESHSEFLFQLLNGGKIFQKKNLKKGIRHRVELIAPKEARAEDFYREIKEEYRRDEVSEEELVDTLVLAYFSKLSTYKKVLSIPEAPSRDSEGFVKAIHFVQK